MTDFQRYFTGAPWEKKVAYCRAVRAGDFVAVTGTASVDDQGGIHAPGDMYEQAKRCLTIISNALKRFGGSHRDIIRTRIFVTDISRWEEVGRAHFEFFRETPPATTMVEVKALIDPGMLVEVEADAVISQQ